jgi:hypothetical protein
VRPFLSAAVSTADSPSHLNDGKALLNTKGVLAEARGLESEATPIRRIGSESPLGNLRFDAPAFHAALLLARRFQRAEAPNDPAPCQGKLHVLRSLYFYHIDPVTATKTPMQGRVH